MADDERQDNLTEQEQIASTGEWNRMAGGPSARQHSMTHSHNGQVGVNSANTDSLSVRDAIIEILVRKNFKVPSHVMHGNGHEEVVHDGTYSH